MQYSGQNQSSYQKQGSNYLQFSNLPASIQERLLKRQRGETNDLSFRISGIVFSFFCIVVGLIWVPILLVYMTNDYLWSDTQEIVFSVITIIAMLILFSSLYRVFRWFTSQLKCYIFITPLYLIKTRFNDIWYWSLKQIIDVNVTHHYYNGTYTNTSIKMVFDEGEETLNVRGQMLAQDILLKLGWYQNLLDEAAARNDLAYLTTNDDFRELKSQMGPQSITAPSKILKWLGPAAASLVCGAILIFAASKINSYFDDKKSWDNAQNLNRASSYRNYIQTHNQGRWINVANQKIQELYEASAKRYETSRKKGYDEQASGAILQALNYAKNTENYHVKVVFERRNEIPEDAAEKLKKQFRVDNILSFGSAFDEYKMDQRQKSLISYVSSALREVIPEDVLELTSNDCTGECVTFFINYKVNAGNSLYYRDSDRSLAIEDRTYYPGISINWDFEIRVPNQTQLYKFSLVSNPAETFGYRTSYGQDPDKDTVYDSMAISAFNDFKNSLVQRLGVGPEEEDTDVTEAKSGKSKKAN